MCEFLEGRQVESDNLQFVLTTAWIIETPVSVQLSLQYCPDTLKRYLLYFVLPLSIIRKGR